MDVSGETVVPFARGRIVLMLVVALLFGAGGAWVALSPEAAAHRPPWVSPPLFRPIGWAGVLVAAWGAVWWTRRLLSDAPALVLTPEGLIDRTGIAPFGLVPWSDMGGYAIVDVAGGRFLVVDLYVPGKYYHCGGRLREMLSRANDSMVGSPFTIALSALAWPAESVADACRQYLDRHGTPRERYVPPAELAKRALLERVAGARGGQPIVGVLEYVHAETAAEAARHFGLRDDPAIYQEVSEDRAIEILAEVLAADMATGRPILPPDAAEDLAFDFVTYFWGEFARYFVNDNWLRPGEVRPRTASWLPATDHAFDQGVLIATRYRTACAWFMDGDR